MAEDLRDILRNLKPTRLLIEQDVVGFQIPVDDSAPVCVFHRSADLKRYAKRSGRVEHGGRHHFAQRGPVDKLHYQEVGFRSPSFIEDRNNIRV